MARKANDGPANTPNENDVRTAVKDIEECYADLATEKGKYMAKAKKIREEMSGCYDTASEKGIAKKLLRKIVKERALERKIAAITDGLEDDEQNELNMLMEKLGEFANTPLGKAALAGAQGAQPQAQAAA